MEKQKTVLLILLLIGVGVLAYYLNSSKQEIKTTNKVAKEKIKLIQQKKDSVEFVNQLQKNILLMDNLYISGNYDSAYFAYKEFIQLNNLNNDYTSIIELRKQRIEEIKSNKDTLYQDYRTLKYALNSVTLKRDSLLASMDSLTSVFSEKISKKEEDKLALKKKIEEQEKLLQRKDKIQVITFKNQQGNTIHYLGEVKEDMANGGGVGIWDTGGIYKGEWKDNARHGKGTYTWKDGHRYEGDFVNGIREGEGTYYWSSGEKYEGQWKDGKRNGEGTLYDKDNNISYQGKWLNDKIAEK
jgi:hypothetical protein